MGYIRHNAIVVTSWKSLEYVAQKARELGAQVVGPSESAINGYSSLLICPDGSKEGWSDSDKGDERRAALREFMNTQRYEDYEWAEVSYGSDDQSATVVHHAWGSPDGVREDGNG